MGMAEIRGGWCRVCVGVGDLHGWLELCHFQNVPMDYVSFAVKQLLSFVSSVIAIYIGAKFHTITCHHFLVNFSRVLASSPSPGYQSWGSTEVLLTWDFYLFTLYLGMGKMEVCFLLFGFITVCG